MAIQIALMEQRAKKKVKSLWKVLLDHQQIIAGEKAIRAKRKKV